MSFCRYCGGDVEWTGVGVYVHVLPGPCQNPQPGIQLRLRRFTKPGRAVRIRWPRRGRRVVR